MSNCTNCEETLLTASPCNPGGVECPVGTINTSCLNYNGDDLLNSSDEGETDINTILKNIDDMLTDSDIRKISVPLSSVQIKALFSSGTTLIAAPGPGKFLDVLSVHLMISGGSSVYTVSSGNLLIKTTNSSGNLFVLLDSCLANASSSRVNRFIPSTSGVDNVRTNDALVIKHASANPIGGDLTASVFITYIIRTI